jgi:hypothetical protein
MLRVPTSSIISFIHKCMIGSTGKTSYCQHLKGNDSLYLLPLTQLTTKNEWSGHLRMPRTEGPKKSDSWQVADQSDGFKVPALMSLNG